ncbi:MAG: flavodoxin family protein [Nitrospiraceae bacterium]|nr:flavodoxin family protein [Nitrospiraceae bacterium]
MRTAVFMGSPRKGGNTQILLDEAMRGAREKGAEIAYFDLNNMKIGGCQDCGVCAETCCCHINDDMQLVYQAIRESYRFILASPIFFAGVSAQAKAMIDRCQPFWCEKYLRKRPIPPEGRAGLFITVGGMKKAEGRDCSFATARSFFRTISVLEHRELCQLGVDARGEILKHPEALKEAYEAGKALMEP